MSQRPGERKIWHFNSKLPLAGARIFIAEDEVLIAMELESLMEDAGASVVGPAHSLSKALQIARSEELTAAILDLRLGVDSVTPVAEVLTGRSIPFLFYSGQPPGDPIRAQWPSQTIVGKPASPQKLVAAVVGLLEREPPRLAALG